jgi:pyruvate dehydrogenase E2 component (dihydrolipoamide acetyltransferase)
MKELFIHRIQEGNAAPVDSLLAIIGPEGTDISGIADNYKAKGSDESTEQEEAESVPEEKEEEEEAPIPRSGN